MRKLIDRPFGRGMGRSIACAACALVAATTPVAANPEGGTVVAGEGTITAPAPNEVRVTQSSKTLILNWDSFDIAEDEITRFLQPTALSLAVNRIGSNDPSQILGTLTANGRIILINPNGLLFGDTARIDVGSLVATTHDLKNEDILAGRLTFDLSGNPVATVENNGTITATSGSIAFVAPGVSNSGTMTARLGTVALAGASKFTLDFEGDNLISFPVDAEVISRAVGSDGKPVDALVSNTGTIEGSTVVLSARSAANIVANAINIEGTVIARSARVDGDDIVLGDPESDERESNDLAARFAPEHLLHRDSQMQRSTTADTGGKIVVDGGSNGLVKANGTLDASGATGGSIIATGTIIYADGHLLADGTVGDGGAISIDSDWLSVGGTLSASGGASGGSIDINAGGLSFAGVMNATGLSGAGGSIDIAVERKSLEFKGAAIDASGASGGSIRNVAGQQITTSATYSAIGTHGPGGTIDLSAPATKLLSPTLNASGFTAGGRIRIGGELQGGKALTVDELPNARTTVASHGTNLYVDVLGPSGAGGTAIIWSDTETVFLGSILARPGTRTGAGGFVEISSAELLQYAGHIETGVAERQGTVLFDPKNINIVDVVVSGIQLQLVLGYNSQVAVELENDDQFGWSVALDGKHLAVGAPGDDGFGAASTFANHGAVYLFSFGDANFASPVLEGLIGAGYTGGKNVDVAEHLGLGEGFGGAVALDGSRLAVGAYNSASGGVYLFTFAEDDFGTGSLKGILGIGYAPTPTLPANLDLTSLLEVSDLFGYSVSMDGLRLAVGTPGDDGQGATGSTSAGAVHLFTFGDSSFSSPTHVGSIGLGYTGASSLDLAELNASQGILLFDNRWFGGSVSLDGDHLAVGLPANVAFPSCTGFFPCVRVALFSFEDEIFSNPSLSWTLSHGSLDYSGLGTSVSLDGNLLAVGEPYHRCPSGAPLCSRNYIHLYSFDDSSFSNATETGVIGVGFPGGFDGPNDFNIASIWGGEEGFGTALALDRGRLAVGQASWGGGLALGRVALFTLDNSSSPIDATFTSSPGSDVTISKNALLALLNSGQSVVLQANNDIKLEVDLLVSSTSGGSGGDLALQAGRSIFINANIFTDNGDLDLIANYPASTNGALGVVDAYREPGAARIEMASGMFINLGSGELFAQVKDGAGLTFYEGGDITLERIFANSLFVDNLGGTGKDIILNGAIEVGSGFFSAFEANNDIILNADLSTSCRGIICTGEDILFRAGRSVQLFGSIDTKGGDVTILANSHIASDAQRDPGPAEILMADGVYIKAYTGHVQLTLGAGESLSGEGLTNRDSGNIHLREVSGRSILVENLGPSEGDIIVNGELWLYPRDSIITSDSSIVVATRGNFINLAGPSAFDEGNGRFLIYANDYIGSGFGGLVISALFDRPYDPFDPKGWLSPIPQAGSFAVFNVPRPRGRELRNLPSGMTVHTGSTESRLKNAEERRRWIVRKLAAEQLVGIPELVATPVTNLEDLSFKLAPYAVLAEASYDSSGNYHEKTLLGFTRIAYIDSPIGQGLSYAVWEKDGKMLAVFEGTDNIVEIVRDVASQLFGLSPIYRDEALAGIRTLQSRFGEDNVSCAGHSLGGTLCAYTAGTSGMSGLTFNQMALNYENFMSRDAIKAAEANILAIRMEGDIFARLFVGTPNETEILGREQKIQNPRSVVRCINPFYNLGCHSMIFLSDTLADDGR